MPELVSFSLTGGREVNEDTVLTFSGDGRIIAVVADGLGGLGGGDVASQAAASAAMNVLKGTDAPPEKALRKAMERANTAVLACQAEKQGKMMSTIAMAVLKGHRAWTATLGDTRVYRFSGGRLQGCSHDDSVPQALADQGEITREEMRGHESRNLLTRCLGRFETPEAEVLHAWRWKSTRLLLCSDGFWEYFPDAELEEEMSRGRADEILERLKSKVLERMKQDGDNCSAVLIG